jgi:hypothetical protein
MNSASVKQKNIQPPRHGGQAWLTYQIEPGDLETSTPPDSSDLNFGCSRHIHVNRLGLTGPQPRYVQDCLLKTFTAKLSRLSGLPRHEEGRMVCSSCRYKFRCPCSWRLD